MKDPISTLRKDPEGLARYILDTLVIEQSGKEGAVSMASDIILALADSIKMMEPATFLNSVTLWREKYPAANGSSIVGHIISRLEETLMEWDLVSLQTRFLWSLFRQAGSQLAEEMVEENGSSHIPGTEKVLSDIADRIPGVIYQLYVNPDGSMGISYLSGRSREIFGFDPDNPEKILPSLLSHLVPWCRDSFLASISEAAANGGDWEFEGEYIKDSGESMFFTGRSTPAQIDGIVQFTGVFLDITARKLAEKKLTESERKFDVIADLMPQVIFEIDEIGNLVFVNKQAFEFFGYSEGDIQETFRCFDHIAAEDYPRMMKNLQKVNQGAVSPGNEYTAIKKNGTRFPVIVYSTRVMQEDRLTGYRGIIVDITQRKKVEEELRKAHEAIEEREKMHRTFLDSTTDFVFLKDEKMRYVLANKAYLDFFGKGLDEVAGKNDFDLMPAEIAANSQESDIKALKAGRVQIYEDIVGDRIYETLKFPIATWDGKKGIGGFIRDITERKRSAEALNEGQQRLRQIIDLVPHFIFAKDIDGKFILANKAVADAYGVEVDDLIGQIDPRSFSSDHQRSALHDDLEVIHNGTRKCIPEEAITDAAGNVRYLQTIKIPFTFSGTETPALLAVSVEITERKAALEALRKSEEKFRRFFEVPLIGVTILEPSGQWLDVNDKFCDMVGYPREELLEKKWQDITPPDNLDSEIKDYNAFLDDDAATIATREKQYRRKDGELIDVIIATHCVRRNDGKPDYTLCVIQDITARKKAERKMAESERELRTILSASPIGIGRVRDRIVEWVNDSLCTISGYSIEEFTGRDTSYLYAGPSEFETVGSRLYREGQAETKWITKDGRTIDVLLQVSQTDNGAYICTVTDMTPLKRAENFLKFTQFSVDSAVDNVYWIDAAGRIAYVNDSACASMGFSRDELLSMTIYDIDLDRPAETWPQMWAYIIERDSDQFESLYRRKDGSAFPVEISISYLSYGEFEYACAFARDITERKKAEEALRESEERWQFALEGSGDGLWDWNVPGSKVYLSKQWKEMLGYAENEITDSLYEWDSRVHPDDKSDVYAKLNSHLEGRSSVYTSQYRLRSKDGTYKWILDRGKVLARSEDGKPIRVIGTHTDITERKHLESQLLQSQKMEAVGTLAGGVAHDFNNLLSAIMGYASLLQMKMDKHNSLYSYASHILTSSEKAANLTQSLLAFSRKQVVDLKPVSLNDTVDKVHRLLERLIPEDVEFRVNKSEERLVVMADVGQLDQVIMNLVTNARDAMPRGGKLTIRMDRAAANSTFMTANKHLDMSDHALIEISDTGIGMDKDTIEKIFEPFFTTKQLGRGTGLGLSIVYGIIKQHNGYIDARSQPGEGSVFSVYLPIVGLEPENEKYVSQIVGGIETILIAEDNKELCRLSMKVLRDHGYSVLAAMDGAAAVEMFRQHKGEIALVILDVVMPKMNGREAYESIRRIDPSVKVIFTSGYTDDIVIERGVENEEYDFLGKPLTPATLLKKIREVLDRRS